MPDPSGGSESAFRRHSDGRRWSQYLPPARCCSQAASRDGATRPASKDRHYRWSGSPAWAATSPLGSEIRPGCPVGRNSDWGSTEIATPGISPAPLPGVGSGTANANCPGFDARSNTPSGTFDGGGLPGGPPSPCISASDANASGVAPPALPTQRAGNSFGFNRTRKTRAWPRPRLCRSQIRSRRDRPP